MQFMTGLSEILDLNFTREKRYLSGSKYYPKSVWYCCNNRFSHLTDSALNCVHDFFGKGDWYIHVFHTPFKQRIYY